MKVKRKKNTKSKNKNIKKTAAGEEKTFVKILFDNCFKNANSIRFKKPYLSNETLYSNYLSQICAFLESKRQTHYILLGIGIVPHYILANERNNNIVEIDGKVFITYGGHSLSFKKEMEINGAVRRPVLFVSCDNIGDTNFGDYTNNPFESYLTNPIHGDSVVHLFASIEDLYLVPAFRHLFDFIFINTFGTIQHLNFNHTNLTQFYRPILTGTLLLFIVVNQPTSRYQSSIPSLSADKKFIPTFAEFVRTVHATEIPFENNKDIFEFVSSLQSEFSPTLLHYTESNAVDFLFVHWKDDELMVSHHIIEIYDN
jgi:hypothetical protein